MRIPSTAATVGLVGLIALSLTACREPAGIGETSSHSPGDGGALTGTWRAALTSPGGELPFALRIDRGEEGGLAAVVLNGAEEAPLSSVPWDGREVELDFAWYDSRITAELSTDGRRLEGTWRRTAAEGFSELPFTATRGDGARFRPRGAGGASATGEAGTEAAGGETADAAAVPDVGGVWAVVFRDEDGSEPARAELTQEAGAGRVTGTFLTPVGDYRYLEGSYEEGVLRLSTFDGAHAFLFHARAQADGTLAGDFFSRDTYHATWTARRPAPGEEVLPDPWRLAGLTNKEGRFAFAFPDLEGEAVSLADPRFAGKVVLVNVFGSWCPNCNDEAPLLARWYERYRGEGLEIVGLAYELTGDAERDRRQVRRFARRHDIGYPLLLAGTSDKADAAATLPDLTAVIAYPTTIFVGRDGRVRRIYSGFAGPGTGAHHERLVAELEGLVEKLLAEAPPAG